MDFFFQISFFVQEFFFYFQKLVLYTTAILQQTGEKKLPLEKELDGIGKIVNIAVLIICVIAFIIGLIQNFSSGNFAAMTLRVDVVGGCNIKKFYGERALSVFIQPPSVEELRKRLVGRGTDAPEVIESRVAKAEYELGFAPKFDTVIVNDDLETAKAEALKVITQFLNR